MRMTPGAIPTRRWSVVCLGAVLVYLSLMLSGCGGAIDIEDVGFVVALGADIDDDSRIRLWLEVAQPGAGAESLAKQETVLAFADGETLYDALVKLETRSARNLALGHVRAIVFGERLARAGLQQVLDPLMRDATLRLKAWVLVTSDPVEDVLSQAVSGQSAGVYIGSLMQREAQRAGVPSSHFVDLVIDTEERGTEPLLARIGVANQDESAGGQAQQSSEPAGGGASEANSGSEPAETVLSELFVLQGAAAFRGDKMVGWLDARQSAAAVLVKSGIQGYEFIHNLAADERESVAVNLMSARASMWIPRECLADPERLKGCTVKVDVSGLWGMRELISKEQYLTDESTVALSKDVSAGLERDIRDMLSTIQTELRSDVIGIGEVCRQRMAHSNWKRISADWNALFESLNLEVTVDIEARRRGQILRAPGADKSI